MNRIRRRRSPMIRQSLPFRHIHPIHISPALLDQKFHHRHPLAPALRSRERGAFNGAMQRAPPELCAPLPQQLQRGDGALARNGLKQGRCDEGVPIRGIRDAGAVRDTPTDEALIMADETEEALTPGECGTEESSQSRLAQHSPAKCSVSFHVSAKKSTAPPTHPLPSRALTSHPLSTNTSHARSCCAVSASPSTAAAATVKGPSPSTVAPASSSR